MVILCDRHPSAPTLKDLPVRKDQCRAVPAMLLSERALFGFQKAIVPTRILYNLIVINIIVITTQKKKTC